MTNMVIVLGTPWRAIASSRTAAPTNKAPKTIRRAARRARTSPVPQTRTRPIAAKLAAKKPHGALETRIEGAQVQAEDQAQSQCLMSIARGPAGDSPGTTPVTSRSHRVPKRLLNV